MSIIFRTSGGRVIMKYNVQNNQALDFCMSVELSDCQDIIVHSPLYDKKAKEIYYNQADFTNINSSNNEFLDILGFLMTLVQQLLFLNWGEVYFITL